MPNMSYCRFHNTLPDLIDCIEALNNRESLSNDEKKAAFQMLKKMATWILNEDIIESDEDGCMEVSEENIKKLLENCVN